MDEILYLEPDEEITSVIDKIKNANSAKLGLVVPRDATILQSVVNLRLLQREAAVLGKEIAIVTTDKIGRNLAAQIGLQVYSSIEEEKPIYQPPAPKPDPSEVIELNMAPKNEETENVPGVNVHHFQEKQVVWRKKQAPVFKPTEPKVEQNVLKLDKPSAAKFIGKHGNDPRIIKKVIIPIVAVILILICIGTYLLLPKATVTIFVPSENLKKEVDLTISNQAKAIDINNNILPGELIQVSDEKKGNFPATGQKNIGTKASGTITIYNNLDSNSHDLASGTQLSSSGKTFVLKSDISVPGASVQNGGIAARTVKADIEAKDVGAEFNIKAGRFTILSLNASQQTGIYGQSNSDIAGGLSKQVQVVSQTDYDNAKNKLIAELTISTKNELNTKIANKKILEKALVTPEPTVTSTASVDGEAKSFDMNIKFTQQVMVFDSSVLKDFLIKELEKQVPTDKMVAIANDGDVGLIVQKTAYDKSELSVKANVIAKLTSKMDTTTIKSAILGKSTSDALNYVKTQNGVSNATIDLWPVIWIKRIPNLERNVTLNVQYEIK